MHSRMESFSSDGMTPNGLFPPGGDRRSHRRLRRGAGGSSSQHAIGACLLTRVFRALARLTRYLEVLFFSGWVTALADAQQQVRGDGSMAGSPHAPAAFCASVLQWMLLELVGGRAGCVAGHLLTAWHAGQCLAILSNALGRQCSGGLGLPETAASPRVPRPRPLDAGAYTVALAVATAWVYTKRGGVYGHCGVPVGVEAFGVCVVSVFAALVAPPPGLVPAVRITSTTKRQAFERWQELQEESQDEAVPGMDMHALAAF